MFDFDDSYEIGKMEKVLKSFQGISEGYDILGGVKRKIGSIVARENRENGVLTETPSWIDLIYSKLFDDYEQNKPNYLINQIKYRSNLILEARKLLKSTKYNNLEIIVDENINPIVLALLQDKFNKGQEFTKFERVIAEVSLFYLGGKRASYQGQLDLNLNPLIPPKSQRIISSSHQGNPRHNQEFMRQTWKKQKLGDDYVFGMIYKWTNKITGKSYVGRTQRVKGTPYFRPYSSMSKRFAEEIRKALVNTFEDMKDWENQFYYDMRNVYYNPKPGQTRMDALRENMDLEIVEIQLLGENFDKDTRIIKDLEDYWIFNLRSQGETLYNVAGGSAGATASYLTTGYGPRDLDEKIEFLLSNGFNGREIGDYIGISQDTRSGLLTSFIKRATGMDTRQARLQYTAERMFELMDDGIFGLDELATHFKGANSRRMLQTLASEHFPMGNEYLKGWLTAKYLREFDFDKNLVPQEFEKYLKSLGISTNPTGTGSYYSFRRRELLYEHWQKKDFIPLLKFYATMIIKDTRNVGDFAQRLGLLEPGMTLLQLEGICRELFGVNYIIAKRMYVEHYYGTLQFI